MTRSCMPMCHAAEEIAVLDLQNEAQCASAWTCYQAGYAGPPWNEWCRCPGCQSSFGSGQVHTLDCPECHSHLEEYWPLAQIAEDIRSLLQRYEGICLVALRQNEVIGLTLGYLITAGELRDELALPPGQRVCGAPETVVAYQDEIVVRPEWQHQRVGRRLYQEWSRWVDERRPDYLVARTLANPPTVVFNWYRRWGYEVVARYLPPDQRVILRQLRVFPGR